MYYTVVLLPYSRLLCVLWPGMPVSHIVGILIGRNLHSAYICGLNSCLPYSTLFLH